MADLVATRTLVKSPPELWQELSEVEGLNRHLGEFGDIRISRLEPERVIAWETERASGTVEIEASSWGTKVVLTADVPEAEVAEPAPEPVAEPMPEPVAEPMPEAEVAEPEPDLAPEPDAAPSPVAAAPEAKPEPAGRARGFLARWLFRERRAAAMREPEPEIEAGKEPEIEVTEEPPIESADEPPMATAPEPEAAPALAPEPEVAPAPEPAPAEEARAEPHEQPVPDVQRALDVLEHALDTLGAAHHRPFSRG